MLQLAVWLAFLASAIGSAMVNASMSATGQQSSSNNDNKFDDGSGYLKFPKNPLLGPYPDEVKFSDFSNNNQTTFGYKTSVDGIFQEKVTGQTTIGFQIEPVPKKKDVVRWGDVYDKAKATCSENDVNFFKPYPETRVATGCRTEVTGFYFLRTESKLVMGWIMCNETSQDVCGNGRKGPKKNGSNNINNSNNSSGGKGNSNSSSNSNNNNGGSDGGDGDDGDDGGFHSTNDEYDSDGNGNPVIWTPSSLATAYTDDDTNAGNFSCDASDAGVYKLFKGGKISSTEFQMTFEVQGKGGAGIAFKLNKDPTELKYALEVVIGDQDDTRSLIRLGTGPDGRVLAESRIPNVLSSSEPRPFWIQLDKNMMTVGQGHTFGQRTLIPMTKVPTIGTQGWLNIGWSCFKTSLAWQYKGPDVSCMNILPKWVPTPPPTEPPIPPPINCIVSNWTAPTVDEIKVICSAKCGPGTYEVTRTITTDPANGGSRCPVLKKDVACNLGPCPPCCQVGEWSPPSTCQRQNGLTCGPGFKEYTRTITVDPNCPDAYKCPTDTVKREDCTTCCPVDCKISEYGSIGPCSSHCGGGRQCSTAVIQTKPSCGGLACPPLSKCGPCNTDQCTECTVSDWVEASPCSKTCGKGQRTLIRNVTMKGDSPYCQDMATVMYEDCNDFPCPRPCVVSNWYNTSGCSAECGGGYYQIEREILVYPENGGDECPHLHDSLKCNEDPCPPKCEVGSWSDWSECSVTCGEGAGTQNKTRESAVNFNLAGSGGLYNKFGTTLVNTQTFSYSFKVQCKKDVMVAFMPTQSTQSADALEIVLASGPDSSDNHIRFGTGSAIPLTSAISNPCLGSNTWVGVWVAMSNSGLVSVGIGMTVHSNELMSAQLSADQLKTLRQQSLLFAAFAGQTTLNHFETYDPFCKYQHFIEQKCGKCCKQDCELSDWSSLTEATATCSAKCGGGYSKQTRYIKTWDACGGTPCSSYALEKQVVCNPQKCPYCDISPWNCTECSESCGPNGKKTCTRTSTAIGGYDLPCPSLTSQVLPCNTDKCCPQNCTVGPWLTTTIPAETTYRIGNSDGVYNVYLPVKIDNTQDWVYSFKAMCYSDMSVVLSKTKSDRPLEAYEIVFGGKGNTVSSIRLGAGSAGQGNFVVKSEATQANVCNPSDMVDFYIQYANGVLSADSSPYDYAAMTSKAPLVSAAVTKLSSDKLYIGFASEAHDVIFKIAPANASDDDGWGACSAPCGGGMQYRYRNKIKDAVCGGSDGECNFLVDSRACNVDIKCPEPCKYSAWSEYGECSAKCGDGVRISTRTVVMSPGLNCPQDTVRKMPCNLGCCKKDCKQEPLGAFGPCDTVCGGGKKRAHRVTTQYPECGGEKCLPDYEEVSCNTQACPPCCQADDWSEWSTCDTGSRTCGKGTQFQTRAILGSTSAMCASVVCPTTAYRERSCDGPCCKQDCELSPWSDYGQCSVKCGGGTKKKTQRIITPAACGGTPCPQPADLVEFQPCNTQPCSDTCTIGAWGNWSKCSKDCSDKCGPGYTFRVQQMGKVATIAVHVQSACSDEQELNQGSVVIGTEAPVKLGDDDDMMYMWSWDNQGNRTKAKSKISEDSNHLSAIGANPHVGAHIIVIHYGSSAGMGSVSSLNQQNIIKLGGSQLIMPLDALAKADVLDKQQKGGWAYVLVVNQGQMVAENRLDGCGSSTFDGDLQIMLEAADDKNECPRAAREEKVCNELIQCPQDCVMSDWYPTDWTPCSASCGDGVQWQHRTIKLPALYGGKPCGITSQWKTCEAGKCPPKCYIGNWTKLSTCDKTCGGGYQTRTREVITPAEYKGEPCPTLKEEKYPCNQQPCPPPPPPTPTPCSGSNCLPPTPPPPPPCKTPKLTWESSATFGLYTRWDSVKVKATDFDIIVEVKGSGGASISFTTDMFDIARDNAYEVQLGHAADSLSYGIYVGTGAFATAKVQWQENTNLIETDIGPKKDFTPFWISLHQDVMKVGLGYTIGEQLLKSATVPKIVGDGCNCLFVGFASNTGTMVFRYEPPVVSCLADVCAAAAELPGGNTAVYVETSSEEETDAQNGAELLEMRSGVKAPVFVELETKLAKEARGDL